MHYRPCDERKPDAQYRELLARIVAEFFDEGEMAVVVGDAQTGKTFTELPFDHLFFTGSTAVGRMVAQAAAKNLTPVTLELGGKSPAILDPSSDLATVAPRLAFGKLLNAGQTCIAPDYVLVESAVRDDLVARIRAAVTEFQSGEPTGQRIVNRRQLDRIGQLLDGAGGTVVAGGGVDAEGLSIEPTIVVDPDPAAPLMNEEIFGPVLPVLTVPSVAAAIEFVNARPKPLALYLFTASRAVKERVLASTSSGGLVIIHLAMHCLVPQLPFGGVGHSGTGAYHGEWGFQAFSHRKAVLSKPAKPDPSLMYPPYTEAKKKLMRRFF